MSKKLMAGVLAAVMATTMIAGAVSVSAEAADAPTIAFVPKVIGIFTAIMILGHWILNEVVVYTEELWNGFSLYIR